MSWQHVTWAGERIVRPKAVWHGKGCGRRIPHRHTAFKETRRAADRRAVRGFVRQGEQEGVDVR